MKKYFLILPLLCFLTACSSDQPATVALSEPETGQASSEGSKTAGNSPVSPEQLAQAALDGDIDTIEQGLTAGFDVDTRDLQGRTLLMYAAFNGHTDIVRKLLDKGAEVDGRDSNGTTALMFASSGPFPDTVRLLLDKGADVNMADTNEHWTALMWAGAEGQAENIRMLLDAGADPALREADGDTAESFALRNGHAEAAKILQKASSGE